MLLIMLSSMFLVAAHICCLCARAVPTVGTYYMYIGTYMGCVYICIHCICELSMCIRVFDEPVWHATGLMWALNDTPLV